MATSVKRMNLTVMSCVAVATGLIATPAIAAEGTPIDEVVIYGIDGDTNQLLRYTFDTDSFTSLGVVMTWDGTEIENTEALAWVPSGPAKGMYCAPRDGDLSGKLLRINPLNATAEVLGDTAEDITAMATVWSGTTWLIVAWDRNDEQLYYIDPLTVTTVAGFSISDIEFEGFAVGPDGTFYANTDTELYTLDLATGQETKVGDTDTSKMESLEFAFGDYDPRIDVSGVPSSWTADGALLGFDDGTDQVLVLDPDTGDTVGFPCSFATVDCEGLVVLTQMTDPYGSVTVEPCD